MIVNIIEAWGENKFVKLQSYLLKHNSSIYTKLNMDRSKQNSLFLHICFLVPVSSGVIRVVLFLCVGFR